MQFSGHQSEHELSQKSFHTSFWLHSVPINKICSSNSMRFTTLWISVINYIVFFLAQVPLPAILTFFRKQLYQIQCDFGTWTVSIYIYILRSARWNKVAKNQIYFTATIKSTLTSYSHKHTKWERDAVAVWFMWLRANVTTFFSPNNMKLSSCPTQLMLCWMYKWNKKKYM